MSEERFFFEGHDGKEYSLPKKFKAGVLRKARRSKDELDYFFTILEEVADNKTLSALDNFDTDELAALAKDWFQGLSPEK